MIYNTTYEKRLFQLYSEYEYLISRPNRRRGMGNGIFDRYVSPVLSAAHVPIHWQYDLDPETNPNLMIRLGVNSVFNAGAIEMDGKILLVARLEGYDRKSFFGVAESTSGIDRFTFWDYPIEIPHLEGEVNIYDMRLTRHEDGWIYGVFCSEKQHPEHTDQPNAAMAQCGIARTKDLKSWERLPNLKTPAPQQRNCVLHPEFIDGQYAFYTRPQDGFIHAGSGMGIAWGLCPNILQPVIGEETVFEHRRYNTINELKNGLGPAPIKTEHGWLQLAHGVRQTADGYRYVLYAFMTALDEPNRIIYRPGGYLIAPVDAERIGDVSSVLFSNGWVARSNGELFIYYASADTRIHVATSTVARITDYVMNTPPDALHSGDCARQRREMIDKNQAFLHHYHM